MAAAATWMWASNRKMGLLKAALAEWRRGEGRAPKVMWKPAIRMQSESYVEIRRATTHSVSLSIIKRNGGGETISGKKSDRVKFIGDKSKRREEIGARHRSPPT